MTALVLPGAASGIAGHSARSTSATPAGQPMPSERSRHDHPADAAAGPWAGEEDDTDLDYYDTPSGNIWRLDTQPGKATAKALPPRDVSLADTAGRAR
jgi:hypothetical protein